MMSLLIDIFGFLSVILRGAILTFQSFTLGGIAFLTLLLTPLGHYLGADKDIILHKTLHILRLSALAFVVTELAVLGLQSSVLTGTLDLTLPEALNTHYASVSFTVIGLTVVVGLLTKINLPLPLRSGLMTVAGLGILAAQVSATHAASRLSDRDILMAANYLHVMGASVWIGGLPYFTIALNQVRDSAGWRVVGRRYSLMSITSVAMIVIGGIVMASYYIGSWEALYGTAYGVMTSTKAIMLGFLLLLGGMNYLTVESLSRNPSTSVLRMKRFVEVELGIGLTILFSAASLTSLPPAEDLTQDRASLYEIVERIKPQWPIRLESPDHASLAIPELQAKVAAAEAAKVQAPAAYIPGEGLAAPRNAEDIAWSEYNHHWAGLFVLLIGLLALIEHMGVKAAKHWPLVFLGLAAFLFIRSDPETWPLGEVGLWESLRDPEVVQHRVFVVLITLFGLFEWGVRTGRIQSQRAALVFPLITALGGALLVTHSHAIANIKEQLLIEITHVPLALTSIIAGWARWLEIRMDGRVARIAGWIWPIAFIMVAVILLIYREA